MDLRKVMLVIPVAMTMMSACNIVDSNEPEPSSPYATQTSAGSGEMDRPGNNPWIPDRPGLSDGEADVPHF